MAARLAGRDPDSHVTVKLSEVVAFDDVMWRYPDFMIRALAAYDVLGAIGFGSDSMEFTEKDATAERRSVTTD